MVTHRPLRLLIIHPCVGRRAGEHPRDYVRTWKMQPLPAAQISALAKATLGERVEVRLQDDRLGEVDYATPADLVCLSVETYTARRAYQIAGGFRRRGVPVVMGGFHATLCPEEVGRYCEALVVGEAEKVFPDLLLDFVAGKMQRRYAAGERPAMRLQPDRSIFHGKKYLPIGLVEFSRGCRFRCDFCAITAAFKASHTHAAMDDVVAQVRLVKKPGQLIFFIDDNLASDPEAAKELCRALKGENVRWVGQASSTAAWDDELLTLMRESGCQGVLVGFESLDEVALKRMNKGFNMMHGGPRECLARFKAAKLRVYGTFIFGYETDTPEVFDKTVSFAREQGLFIAAFNHITPFPGTPLYDRLKKDGKLRFDAWWLHPDYRYNEIPFHPEGMDAPTLERGCLEARKSFYSWPSIWQRLRNNPANLQTPRMALNYLLINAMHQRDVVGRSGMPLGDLGESMDLLEAEA